ncbi:hypothetical protein D3C71_1668010 [compost metagenome]
MRIRFEHNMLVYFIRNDKCIEFHSKAGDNLQFAPGEYFARRVRGVAQNDRFDALLERATQFFRIEQKFRWGQRYINRGDAGQYGISGIIFVEG